MYMKKYIAMPEVSLDTSLKVDVYYSKWKWVYIGIRWVKIEQCDWYKVEKYMLFGNSKDRNVLIFPMKRLSGKFDWICQLMKQVSDVEYLNYYNRVEWENEVQKLIDSFNK